MNPGLRLVTLLVGGALLIGCARTRQEELAPVERGAVGFEVLADGPWREMPIGEGDAFEAPAFERHVVQRRPAPKSPRAPKARPPAGPPSLALLPRRRPLPAASRDGGPPGPQKSPDERRRDRYLDNPSRIKADRIAFYCPAALAREVQLTGASVETRSATRRIATGRARLLCRELTLEGEKISLTIRGEDPDVQITARGDVHFVTRQKVQTLREEGVRTLIITNEQIVPLR